MMFMGSMMRFHLVFVAYPFEPIHARVNFACCPHAPASVIAVGGGIVSALHCDEKFNGLLGGLPARAGEG
jgi:hypothetical protein